MVRILTILCTLCALTFGQGTLSIQFYEPVMNGLGLPVSDRVVSAVPESPGYDGYEVALAEAVAATGFPVTGGFALAGKPLALRLEPGPRDVTIAPAFVLKRCHRGAGRWMQGDLCLAPEFAKAQGIPEHAGRVVGVADVVLPEALDPVGANDPGDPNEAGDKSEKGAKGGDCAAPFGPEIDVQLTNIDDIGAVHWDADRVAFAPSAVLENVSTNAIRWYWAIFPSGFNGPNVGEHPFLALAMYRLDPDGGFSQIGRSDLKHAWNTVNFGCPCAGGQVMWPGCMDVYGVANNNNQYFFAPRDELTAHSAAWESMGSHFDATPVDNKRDHFDNPGEHGPFEHRLTVSTADLQVEGARYFAEAWYIAAGDTNVFNSIGYREVTPVYTTNAVADLWTFNFSGAFKPGAAIGELASADGSGVELLDTGEGRLLLAAESEQQPEGNTRFRYTLMNLDYDRQLAQFEIPVVAGSTTTQHAFEDGDSNPTNDWSAVVAAGSVRWSGPPIDWGRMVSFEFVSDAAGLPGGAATLLALEPSTIGTAASLPIPTAASPNVAPAAIPVIALAESGGMVRCTWNAVPGASYQVQIRDEFFGWIDRGVSVTATSAQGEYLELNPGARGLYRVQLLSLP